jgi:hypothetical protein
MNTTPRSQAMKHFAQIYTGKPYTGSPEERELIMMMLTNSQGSVGLEEVICTLLNLKQVVTKHGFDAIDEKTGAFFELKPSMLFSPVARYNDVTEKKIAELKNCKNELVFETHIDGRMIFLAKIDGQKLVEMLEEKYLKRKAKIETGKTKGTRQSHGVKINEIIHRFGAKSIDVVYYFPHDKFNKTTKKLLNLTKEVNNLPA